jgi:hypothetical protein
VPPEHKEVLLGEPERGDHDLKVATEVPAVEALVAGSCAERSVVAQERLTEPSVVTHEAAVEQRGFLQARAQAS